MKSFNLSGKQLSIIFIQVALFGLLWIAPELIKPYVVDNKITTSSFYTVFTFIYWFILLASVAFWERKSPTKLVSENSSMVVIPIWRRVLVILLIPLALLLVAYFG